MGTYELTTFLNDKIPQGKRVSIEEDQLPALICKSDWSPSVFNTDHRSNANFESTQFMTLDVDGGHTLEQALMTFAELKHVIATTRNHQKVKHPGERSEQPACDRFRVILFLEKPITDPMVFRATWQSVMDRFPFIDKSVKDPARFFYRSQEVISVNPSGCLIELVTPSVVPSSPPLKPAKAVSACSSVGAPRGKLSRATMDFLIHGAPPGEFNSKLFKAAKDHHEQGIPLEEFVERWAALHPGTDGKLYPFEGRDLRTVQSAYEGAKYPPRLSCGEGLSAQNPFQRTYDWLRTEGLVGNYKTQVRYQNGKTKLLSKVAVDCYERLLDTNSKVSLRDIELAIEKWMEEEDEQYVERIKSNIAHDPSISAPWDELMTAIKGMKDDRDIAALKHFIWQVKRKLWGLRVEKHLMPVLFGPQECGKSEFVRKLIAPLERLVSDSQTMDSLSDTREANVFAEYAIVFYDEMARAERGNIAQIKNIISSPTVEWRPMRTNKREQRANIATFIACSNNPLKQVLADNTGVRRFWQIDAKSPTMDWEVINGMDYLALWRSVNENASTPILGCWPEIQTVQRDELRFRDPLEIFLEEHVAFSSSERTYRDSIYHEYVGWMEDQHKQRSVVDKERFKEDVERWLRAKAPPEFISRDIYKNGRVAGGPPARTFSCTLVSARLPKVPGYEIRRT